MKKRFLFALALVASQCAVPVEPAPALPDGAIAFEAPARWEAFADSMARCSGLTYRGAIQWWVVPDGSLGPTIAARWDYPHRIALAQFYFKTQNGTTIMHELLHDLLGKSNWPEGAGHPPVFAHCAVNP